MPELKREFYSPQEQENAPNNADFLDSATLDHEVREKISPADRLVQEYLEKKPFSVHQHIETIGDRGEREDWIIDRISETDKFIYLQAGAGHTDRRAYRFTTTEELALETMITPLTAAAAGLWNEIVLLREHDNGLDDQADANRLWRAIVETKKGRILRSAALTVFEKNPNILRTDNADALRFALIGTMAEVVTEEKYLQEELAQNKMTHAMADRLRATSHYYDAVSCQPKESEEPGSHTFTELIEATEALLKTATNDELGVTLPPKTFGREALSNVSIHKRRNLSTPKAQGLADSAWMSLREKIGQAKSLLTLDPSTQRSKTMLISLITAYEHAIDCQLDLENSRVRSHSKKQTTITPEELAAWENFLRVVQAEAHKHISIGDALTTTGTDNVKIQPKKNSPQPPARIKPMSTPFKPTKPAKSVPKKSNFESPRPAKLEYTKQSKQPPGLFERLAKWWQS